MLCKVAEVPDLFETGIRTIMTEAVVAVLQKLQLSRTIGKNIQINSFGTTVNLFPEEAEEFTVNRDYCSADVTVITDENNLPFGRTGMSDDFGRLSRRDFDTQNNLLFLDTTNGIQLAEVTQPVGFSIELEIGLSSQTKAITTAQKMNRTITHGLMDMSVDYNYLIPDAILIPMLMLNRRAGYTDEEFVNRLIELSGDAIELGSNRNNTSKKAILAKRSRKQVTLRVQRNKSYGDVAGSEKSPEGRKLNLTVEMQMSLVDALHLSSEPVVGNTLCTDILPQPNKLIRSYNTERTTNPFISEEDYKRFYPGMGVYPTIVPWYDSWRPPFIPGGYHEVFQQLFTLDNILDEEPATTIALDDLGITNAAMLDLMKDLGSDMFRLGCGIFIRLYHADGVIDAARITYDDTTASFTVTASDIRGVYRMVIYVTAESTTDMSIFRKVFMTITGATK